MLKEWNFCHVARQTTPRKHEGLNRKLDRCAYFHGVETSPNGTLKGCLCTFGAYRACVSIYESRSVSFFSNYIFIPNSHVMT